jgi:hypothetical protein
MQRFLFFAGFGLLLLLSSCSKTSVAPTSLTNTSWKYTVSSSNYQVLKFTTASTGTYSVTSSGETKSYSFTYTYTEPDVVVTVSNGEKLDGDFTAGTTLEVISDNGPSSAIKFTKQ